MTAPPVMNNSTLSLHFFSGSPRSTLPDWNPLGTCVICKHFVLVFFHKLGTKRNAELLTSLRRNSCVDSMPCSVIQKFFQCTLHEIVYWISFCTNMTEKKRFCLLKVRLYKKDALFWGDSACTCALLLGQMWVACADKIKYLSRLLVDCSVNSSSTVSRSALKHSHEIFLAQYIAKSLVVSLQ